MRYYSWLTNLVLTVVFILLVLSSPHVQAGDTGQHYVPFKVVKTNVGICNTAGHASANPHILIDSAAASGTFMVTSILIAPSGTTGTGTQYFITTRATINGMRFHLKSRNLAGGEASPVDRGFDIMGVPLLTGRIDEQKLGGSFPHTIVANSAGDDDIDIMLFCRYDDSDVNIGTIMVAGWKQASDRISVKYKPGE
jgi:hypothetical protein